MKEAPREPAVPGPLKVVLEPGKYAFCACGRTGKPPFCDGSHKGTEITPVIEVVEGEPRRFAWCTCRTSKKLPFCDGSHRALQ